MNETYTKILANYDDQRVGYFLSVLDEQTIAVYLVSSSEYIF